MQDRQKTNLFALSKREQLVWPTLVSPVSLAQIARQTKLPRSSVVRAVGKLCRRGLAVPQKTGRRTTWQQATDQDLKQQLMASVSIIGLSALHPLKSPGLTQIQGSEEIAQAIISALTALPRCGQFNGIQTSQAAIHSIHQVGLDNVTKINELIKTKKIIVRGVVSADGAQKMYQQFGDAWLSSFRGRTSHFVTVPDMYLNFATDLYLIGQQVLIINWLEKTAIHISQLGTVALIDSLFHYLFEHGDRIDYHLSLN